MAKKNKIQQQAQEYSSPLYANADERRIDYGVKAVYIAKWNGQVLDLPLRQIGATAYSSEITQEPVPQKADNQIHLTIYPDPTVSGEVTFLQMDDQLKEVTGWYQNQNGIWTSSGVNSPVALMFIKESFNGSKKALSCFIAYNVTLGKPGEDTTTTSDSIEAIAYTCTFTGSSAEFALDDKGNPVALGMFYTPSGFNFADVDKLITEEGIPLPNQTLNLKDDIPPTFERSTSSTIEYEVDQVKNYSDLLIDGAITVVDNIDGNLADDVVYTEGGSIKLPTDAIDTTSATITDKTVILSVADKSGNEAEPLNVKYSVTAPV